MQFYKKSQDHKGQGIVRSRFNAQTGQVHLALERLRYLAESFPKDPDVAFAEAIIRLDYLGQHGLSRKLLENAYSWGGNDASVVHNLALAAIDEQEFFKWAEISEYQSQNNRDYSDFYSENKRFLEIGLQYWQIVVDRGIRAKEEKEYGSAAAFFELALLHVEKMPPENQLGIRKSRAQCLRALDKEAHQKRESQFEEFPPEERIALHQAIVEIDKIILLDEFDPVMWNFKSAWCNQLKRYDEAMYCAKRSIELRPHNYPKPWINVSDSLFKQKKFSEARVWAEEALKHTEGTEYQYDKILAHKMIKMCSIPPVSPSLNNMSPLISRIYKSVAETSYQEYHFQNPESLKVIYKIMLTSVINGAYARFTHFNQGSIQKYSSIMAEMLDDFTPETVFIILNKIALRNQKIFKLCIVATQYLVAHSTRALQRDAARFLSLHILNGMDIKALYCQGNMGILEEKNDDIVSNIADIINHELARINHNFSQLIGYDNPGGTNRIKRALMNILFKFKSN
jgi:tetratricopeptide (TPR) repeat protein